MPQPIEVLTQVFGYAEFRGQQADIVTHIANGNSAFVLMPTGGGKSLCYQVPALIRSGVTVVISPLIALMQDQVAALRRRGVAAELLNSTLSPDESLRIEHAVRAGTVKLLYLSPERLVTNRTLALLESSELALFAIDEAHCISEWGHDFRPEYLALSLLHERFPSVPRVALTATADADTRAEIRERLALRSARVFLSSFDRPNISYAVVLKRDAHEQLLSFITHKHAGETGIVYRQSRNGVDETTAFLDARGIPALPYHAGLTATERDENQRWFLSQHGVVMVATIAFGMGIDKPDVRFVAHLDVPKSVEGYYQETGRAGRDGLPAEAWLTFSPHDATPLHDRIAQSRVSARQRSVQSSKLDALVALCESVQCRRVSVLNYFGESITPCGRCDTCITPPPSYDATETIRALIACVYRVGARAEASHVINVLRGTDSVSQFRGVHAGIFGAGAHRTETEWRAIIRQCVAIGVLDLDDDRGVLARTERSSAVMRGELRITLQQWRTAPKPAKRRRPRVAWDGSPASIEALDRLTNWRAQVADRLAIPQHGLLSDRTLIEIATKKPTSRRALRSITGMHPERLSAYGDDLISVVTMSHANAE